MFFLVVEEAVEPDGGDDREVAGTWHSSTMMVMMTAMTPSEKASRRAGVGSAPRSPDFGRIHAPRSGTTVAGTQCWYSEALRSLHTVPLRNGTTDAILRLWTRF